MSEPTPTPPTKAPLSLGRRAGIAIGALLALFAGGCSILFLSQGGSREWNDLAIPVGGIPFATGVAILLSAYLRGPRYTTPRGLSTARRLIAGAGIVIMIIAVFSFLGLHGVLPIGPLPYPLFFVGLVIWWLAIRVGR